VAKESGQKKRDLNRKNNKHYAALETLDINDHLLQNAQKPSGAFESQSRRISSLNEDIKFHIQQGCINDRPANINDVEILFSQLNEITESDIT